MVNEELNYIITYEGSKDEFLREYQQTLNHYNCSIVDYVPADDMTIVFMKYPGVKPGELEEKLSDQNRGNLYIERDAKENKLPKDNNMKGDYKNL